MLLRIVDQAGNHTDYETNFVPRIGERITLDYGVGGQPVTTHYFRVDDVMYKLNNSPDDQVAILVKEESDPQHWPS